MVEIQGVEDLRSRVGQTIGYSSWHEITQADIDAFAAATGDHQWIHVDPERARETPFGGTIAHGLLTLSLGPQMSYEIYSIAGIEFGLNYGFDRVRWPAPLPAGSHVRMRADLAEVADVPGGVQLAIDQTFEREGSDKPVCVARSLVRVYDGG